MDEISRLRERVATLRGALEELLESHTEMLDAMTDHGDVTDADGFGDDYAAAKLARSVLARRGEE